MLGKLSGWDDTIVALATPPGIGAIGIIRLSGKKSLDMVNALFPSKDLFQQPSHTVHVGFLKEKNKVLDEVVISLFKKPKSYTGEDVVEISCHGSPYIQQQIIEACIKYGARLAKPGEFTQRAPARNVPVTRLWASKTPCNRTPTSRKSPAPAHPLVGSLSPSGRGSGRGA